MIIGTLGLLNASVTIGFGLFTYFFGYILILIGLVMLAGAWALYFSRYLIGSFLILVPGLYAGWGSWGEVLGFLGVPFPIAAVVGFAMIILTSAVAFGMHIRQWSRRKSGASPMSNKP